MSMVEMVPILYNYLYGNGLQNQTTSLSYYFAMTTVANFDSSKSSYITAHKYLNTIPDLISTFIFIVFYFYWLRKGNKIT